MSIKDKKNGSPLEQVPAPFSQECIHDFVVSQNERGLVLNLGLYSFETLGDALKAAQESLGLSLEEILNLRMISSEWFSRLFYDFPDEDLPNGSSTEVSANSAPAVESSGQD